MCIGRCLVAVVAVACLGPVARADVVGVIVEEKSADPKDPAFACAAALGLSVCNVYVEFDSPTDQLVSVQSASISTLAPGGFFQVPEGGDTAPLEALLVLFPDLACDSFVTIDRKVVPDGDVDCTTLGPDFDTVLFNSFGVVVGSWSCNNPGGGQGIAGADLRVLVAQFAVTQGSTVGGDMTVFYNQEPVGVPLSFLCGGCFDDADCDDGDVCNGLETCVAGICVPGEAVDCDDADPCTIDSCDPVLGCLYEPVPCPPGQACDGGVCVPLPTGGCCQCDGATQFCSIEPVDICATLGGEYLGDDTSCESLVVTSLPNVPIPDGDPAGIADSIIVTVFETIQNLAVTVEADHTFLGDLCVRLDKDGGSAVLLLDRIGADDGTECHFDGPFGCSQNNMNATLDDGADESIEDQCAPDLTGTFRPSRDALAAFVGEQTAGTWTLTVSDNASFDTGTFISWSLRFTTAESSPCSPAFPDQCGVACPWDCGDGNGAIDTVDFLALLAEWGSVGTPCDFGLGNPGVDTPDFLKLLASWGQCP